MNGSLRIADLFQEWHLDSPVVTEVILKADKAISNYVEHDSSGIVSQRISNEDLGSSIIWRFVN